MEFDSLVKNLVRQYTRSDLIAAGIRVLLEGAWANNQFSGYRSQIQSLLKNIKKGSQEPGTGPF